MGTITSISQAAASRRFHQGLFYLLGSSDQGRQKPDPEVLLAITTVMAFLAAYAFPGGNLHDVKQRMLIAFEPFKNVVDIEPLLDRALALAEVFRRPWTEAGNPDESTI
jgi:hypothetical protein